MATDSSTSRLPRLGARGIVILPFVGVMSVSPSAWAFPPQVAESDSSDGAAVGPSPFPVPEGLQANIRFWRDLFTRHTSDRVVVHDRDNLDVVWRVIELPKRDDGAVDERLADRVVKAAVDDLKARLRRLEADPTPADEEDQVLLTLAGGDRARIAGACNRIRTQVGVADQFQQGLSRARNWIDGVRQILTEEGVPTELAALPFVESMFNPLARSYAGAAGVWQLLPGTARERGLKIARGADERMDVLKSTRAAARLLRGNYRMLGSWPLAITAYNYGQYGLKRACDQIGSTDLVTIIGTYDGAMFGFAPKNFYAEFLAALSVVNEAMGDAPAASVRD